MAIDGKLEKYKEDEFPHLAATGYRITSPATRAYNCFAWAAGEDDRWWNPLEPNSPYYWPDGVPAELTLLLFKLIKRSDLNLVKVLTLNRVLRR